jgi:hypothetical protein
MKLFSVYSGFKLTAHNNTITADRTRCVNVYYFLFNNNEHIDKQMKFDTIHIFLVDYLKISLEFLKSRKCCVKRIMLGIRDTEDYNYST